MAVATAMQGFYGVGVEDGLWMDIEKTSVYTRIVVITESDKRGQIKNLTLGASRKRLEQNRWSMAPCWRSLNRPDRARGRCAQ